MTIGIGSLVLHAWRGTIQRPLKPVQAIYRAGVTGTGLLVGAPHAPPSPVETDFYGTLADIGTWLATAVGYVGTSVSATDANGTAWTDVGVLSLQYTIMRAAGLGGTSTHVIRASWSLVAES